MKLSSTQIGAIAENHVANMLMITSGGRLSAFQPVADDDGIDLLIYDKKSGRALPAQVKCRTVTINRAGKAERSDIVHFELRKATYRDRPACAIFVLLTEDATAVALAWVFPLSDMPKYARKGNHRGRCQEVRYPMQPGARHEGQAQHRQVFAVGAWEARSDIDRRCTGAATALSHQDAGLPLPAC